MMRVIYHNTEDDNGKMIMVLVMMKKMKIIFIDSITTYMLYIHDMHRKLLGI